MPREETTTEVSLSRLLRDIENLEGIVSSWDPEQQNTVLALRNTLEALNKEAFARLIKNVKAEPAAFQSLKTALADEFVYAVLRYHQLVKPSLHERVETALATIRPTLATHGGNVELVAIEPPATAIIRLLGACNGCPASDLTLSEGVEKAIKEHCPEITEIKKATSIGSCSNSDGGVAVSFISPFARSEEVGWTPVAKIYEIPEGDIKVVEIDGQTLLLTKFSDRVMCYQNACAHLGMPLDMGKVESGFLICPYHGFKYSLDSGECLTAPEVQLQTHAVRVLGDQVEVRFV